MGRHGPHVFVVDDEVQITQSLSLILSREGFRVSSFNNPLEALESMKTTSPDLLIACLKPSPPTPAHQPENAPRRGRH